MTDRAEAPATLAALRAAAGRLKWELRLEAELRRAGAPGHVREFEFAREVGRAFRLDFAWPERLFGVEVNGGGWMGPDKEGRRRGAHGGGEALERDCEKLSLASALGWRVAAVTPSQVKDGRAVLWILAALEGCAIGAGQAIDEARRGRLARAFAIKSSPAAWGVSHEVPASTAAPVRARVGG